MEMKMIAVDMLRTVLAPLDSYWRTLSRVKLMIRRDTFKEFVRRLIQEYDVVVFWYNTDLLSDSPLHIRQYAHAITSSYGLTGIITNASNTQLHHCLDLYNFRRVY